MFKKLFRVIVILAFFSNVTFPSISSAQQSPVPSPNPLNIQGQGTFAHSGTGLIPPTAADIAKSKRTHKRIHKVHLNRIGWQRANDYRQKHKMPTLGDDVIAPAGQEAESAIDTSTSSPNTSTTSNTVYNSSSSDTVLPDSVDNSNSPWFPPIGNQAQLGSCTSFTTTYYQLSYAIAKENNWTISTVVNPSNQYGSADPTKTFSPRWTYNMVDGGANGGQSLYDPLMLLESSGAPTWALFPYNGTDFTSWPTTAPVWLNALSQRINPYQNIPNLDGNPNAVMLVKQLLNNGELVGIATGNPNNGGDFSYTTIKSCTTSTCNPNGYTIDNTIAGQQAVYKSTYNIDHSMTLVGYDDNVWVDVNGNGKVDPGEMGAFKVANQWGSSWGNKGFMWFAYDSLNSVSTVANGNNANRGPVFQYLTTFTVRTNTDGTPYTPKVVGQFTLTDAQRNNLYMSLGVSATSQPPASNSFFHSYAMAGNGGALPFTGTAVLDYTDILPSGNNTFYLGMYDADSTGKEPATLSGFSLTDSAGNILGTANVSTSNTLVSDGSQKYSTLFYDYTGQLTLNVNQNLGGTIAVVSPTTASFNPGTNAVITMTPASGYYLSYITDNNTNVFPNQLTLANGIYTYNLNNITVNHSLSANFGLIIPYISAGSDFSTTTGASSNLSGFIEDYDGGKLNYSWQSVYGPGNVTFGTPIGTVSNYQANSTVQFSAPGYYMLQLTGTEGTATATSDIGVTVTGAPVTYTVTASAGTNGSISPSGNTTINSGSSQTYTITPNSGYIIAGITVNGTALTGTLPSSYTFPNVTSNQTISVTFAAATYTVTASAGSGGSISPSGALSVNSGANQVFTVTPNTGFSINQVLLDGNAVTLTNNTYTLTSVTAAHTLAVTFSPNTYAITASAGSNGTISPSGSVNVNYGANQAFTFTPNSGYGIASISVNGTALTGTLPSSYTFSNVTSNQTISATFTALTYTITASAGVNGSISPSGAVSVNFGSNQTFTITPSSGYGINQVLLDGSAVTVGSGNTYTLSNVTAAHTIAASFAQLPSVPYYVSAFPGNSQVYIQGSDFNNEGITTFNVKRSLVSGGPYTTIGTENYLTSSGIYIDNSAVNGTTYYYVLSAVNPAGESLNSAEVNATPSLVPPAPSDLIIRTGTNLSQNLGPFNEEVWNLNTNGYFYYTPSLTFNIYRSTSGGPYTKIGQSGPGSWNTVNTDYFDYSIVPGTSYSYCVSAFSTVESQNCASPTQTEIITASAGTGGTISPSGAVNVTYGANQTFTVTPNAGYTASLTIDGTPVTLTNNTYTLSNVTAAHTLAATFLQNTYVITASAGSNGSITPTSATVAYGGSQLFTLTPATGYTASLTVDGTAVNLTNNAYNLSNVIATHTLAASFSSQTETITASAGSNGTISPSGAVSVAYGANQTFTVTPDPNYTAILTVDGTAVTLNNNTYTLNSVTGAHTVTASFSLQNEIVTASANTGGTISPSGAVNVPYGGSQIFTLTPNAGNTPSLTVDGAAVVLTNNTYTLNNVTSAHIIVANFTVLSIPVGLNATAGANSVTLQWRGILGATSFNVKRSTVSGGPYTTIASPSISFYIDAPPVSGIPYYYVVSAVNASGESPNSAEVSATPIVMIPMSSTAGSNGQISPSGTTWSTNYGNNVAFTVTPNAGYVASLTDNGTPVTLTNNTYTLTDIIVPHTLVASFNLPPVTVTASAGTGGTISPSGTVSVANGANQTFTVTPNAGYTASLTVDGSPVALTNNTYTLNDVTTTHTVAASFALQTETVTASAGSGGTITPSGALSVNYGSNQTFTVAPNAGYNVNQVLIDGTAVTLTNNNVYSLTNITASHTIAASFSLQNVTITASAGTGGTISPSGAVNVPYGANQTFTVTPNAGYTASLTIDGTPVTLTNNAYTLSNVTATHTLAAIFTLNSYTITTSAGSNGAITPTSATVAYGGGQLFTITPAKGYTASLTVDGTAVALTNNTYTLSNVTAIHTLAATFTQNTYAITASAGSNGTITPTSATVAYGGSQTFSVTPATGYSASLTVDGSAVTLTNNAYTLSNVTATHTLAANFTLVPVTYTLNVIANNGTVAVSPNQSSYASGAVVTLTATGASGYVFGSWSGDATGKTNPIKITMTKNMNVTATFNVNQAPIIIPGNYAPITPTAFPVTVTFNNTTVTDDGLGIPNGYLLTTWSGPSGVTFANKNQVQTTATFSQAGTFLLTLTAFDGQLQSSKQIEITIYGYNLTVNAANGTVTANPPNQGSYAPGTVVTLTATPAKGYNFNSWSGSASGSTNPLTITMNANAAVTANFSALSANAGSNQTQTMLLPATINLNGSVKSAASSLWSVDPLSSGTGSVTFTNPANPVTSAKISQAGTYLLDLTAYNGTETPVTAQVTINIIAGFTLNITAVNGSVSKNPNQAVYATGTPVTLTAVSSNAAKYQFNSWSGDAVSTDDPLSITVNGPTNITANFTPVNQSPVTAVGSNQTINLPGLANLTGSVKDDGLPAPGTLTTTWSVVSYSGAGAGNVTFAIPNQTLTTKVNTSMPVNTSAKFSDPGTYVLALSASDGLLTSNSATVTITVNPAAMYSLIVNSSNAIVGNVTINPVQTLYASGTQVTLTANTVDAGFGFASWSGNGSGSNPTITITMNANKTVTANFKSLNTAPVVNAGVDQSISLPSNVTLNGQVSDDGLPLNPGMLTYTWSKYAGPGNVTFSTPTQSLSVAANVPMTVNTTAAFSAAGTYVLKLSAFDGQLTSQPSYVTVTVGALPAYILNVTATNGSVTLSPSQPMAGYPLGTKVILTAKPAAGYLFASWSGDATGITNTATIVINANSNNVTANFGMNTPPIVMAGVYDAPVPHSSSLALNAKIIDDGLGTPNGTVKISWTKVSGPGTVTFSNASQANSDQPNTPVLLSAAAVFSKAGTYVLQLTASDGQLTSSKQVLVTVD